jgi:hypothetical protein
LTVHTQDKTTTHYANETSDTISESTLKLEANLHLSDESRPIPNPAGGTRISSEVVTMFQLADSDKDGMLCDASPSTTGVSRESSEVQDFDRHYTHIYPRKKAVTARKVCLKAAEIRGCITEDELGSYVICRMGTTS